MKTLILILIVLFSESVLAQITISPNPLPDNQTSITISGKNANQVKTIYIYDSNSNLVYYKANITSTIIDIKSLNLFAGNFYYCIIVFPNKTKQTIQFYILSSKP